MELINDGLAIMEVVSNALPEARRHIAGYDIDVIRITIVSLEILNELINSCVIFSFMSTLFCLIYISVLQMVVTINKNLGVTH